MSQARRVTHQNFDESYWKTHWLGRVKASFDATAKQSLYESEKKWVMYTRYFGGKSKEWTVLDAGCGLGHFVYYLREKQKVSAWGIDGSEFALQQAHEAIKPFLVLGDITACPFQDEAFELVTAFDVLEHLEIVDIFKAVEELERIAKKALFFRLPTTGFELPAWSRFITDRRFESADETHISIYPIEFWMSLFTRSGKFRFAFASLWPSGDDGKAGLESWLGFLRK